MATGPDVQFRTVRQQLQTPGGALSSDALAVSVTVQASGLLVEEPGGRSSAVGFAQVAQMTPGAYRLEVRMLDGSLRVFSQLGYDYEPFVSQVYRAWNAFVSDALFVDEPCLLEVQGDLEFQAPAVPLLTLPAVRVSDAHGDTRFRITASSLLALPMRSPVVRVPLCFVESIRRDGWRVIVETDVGDRLVLGRLGHDTDEAQKVLEDAVLVQTARALALLKQVLGASDATATPLPEAGLVAAARLLREGRVADASRLELVCPGLVDRLDAVLRLWSADGYYLALRRVAEQAGSPGFAIGIRREQGIDALAAGRDGPQHEADADGPEDAPEPQDAPEDAPVLPAFWIAVPLPGPVPCVAVEAVSSVPLAQATYLFDPAPLDADWTPFRTLLNQGLEAVDFRRQPVYFPLEKLQQPAYARDLAALRFCPPLSFLRSRYRRRLVHSDTAKWEAALRKHLLGATGHDEKEDA